MKRASCEQSQDACLEMCCKIKRSLPLSKLGRWCESRFNVVMIIASQLGPTDIESAG